jgi:phosphatidyl-myo-inositol dimannoside synthase
MRILVLTTDAFGGHGGIAKFNRDLLTALCAYPDCMEVVAIPRIMQKSNESLPSRLTCVTDGLSGKRKYIVASLKYIISKSKYDLVVCAHINLIPLAFFVKKIVRAPLLLFMHGIDVWQPTKSTLANYVVRYIDDFVSVSNLTKQRFLRWAQLRKKKGFILPNAIDFDRFTPGKKSTALLDRYGLRGKTVLMTLGRLAADERAKGFDEILELLPRLIKEKPNIAYLIAGDGTDRSRLEDKVKRLGLTEHVVFAGLIDEEEKIFHYRLADAYIMPSRFEGFGIVFLEAMACGIPVVASKVDGSREAVRDGKLGILIDPDNPEEIKAGIFEALERPKGVVPEGLDYFSYSNFEQRCHCIIDQVLADRKRKSLPSA